MRHLFKVVCVNKNVWAWVACCLSKMKWFHYSVAKSLWNYFDESLATFFNEHLKCFFLSKRQTDVLFTSFRDADDVDERCPQVAN